VRVPGGVDRAGRCVLASRRPASPKLGSTGAGLIRIPGPWQRTTRAPTWVCTRWRRRSRSPRGRRCGPAQGETDGVQGPLLEPPGPLLAHLHTVYMAYSECLLTRLNPLAERACFPQVPLPAVVLVYALDPARLGARRHQPDDGDGGERDAELAQKSGQLPPFIAVFPQECTGQLAPSGPT
jgi:hypothetical protein